MARGPRKKSKSQIYHIMLRGINKQIVFNENVDYEKFLKVMRRCKVKSEYQVYAYCLMENHLHLLLKEGKEPLEIAMKRICCSYVYWYNLKYQRVGNLFQDRFKSEPVEDDKYFITVLRYIHQNPVKAGIEKEISSFKWCSYCDYLGISDLTDTEYVLSLFNKDRKKSIELFVTYINEDCSYKELEVEKKQKTNDIEAKKIIENICNFTNPYIMQTLGASERDIFLKKIKQNGISGRQIERLTGISRGTVARLQ